MAKHHNDVIKSVMAYGRFKKPEQAEQWAINNFGANWRNRKAPKAKRVVVKDNGEKEWDDE